MVGSGLSLVAASPALATWSEGSEPGQNIDPARTPSPGIHAAGGGVLFAVFWAGGGANPKEEATLNIVKCMSVSIYIDIYATVMMCMCVYIYIYIST